MVLPSGTFWNHRATIVALVNASCVPAIYPERDYADSGGLIAFGPNIPDCFRRAAAYVDRILRGARMARMEHPSPLGHLGVAHQTRRLVDDLSVAPRETGLVGGVGER